MIGSILKQNKMQLGIPFHKCAAIFKKGKAIKWERQTTLYMMHPVLQCWRV